MPLRQRVHNQVHKNPSKNRLQESIGRRVHALCHPQHDHIRRQTRKLAAHEHTQRWTERTRTPLPTNTSARSAMAMSTAIETWYCAASNCTSTVLTTSVHPSSANAPLSSPNAHAHSFDKTYTLRNPGCWARMACSRATSCVVVGKQCSR